MKNLEIPQFKIRCSAIGKIMTEPQGKSVEQKIADCKNALAETVIRRDGTRPELKTYANLCAKILKIEAEIAELETQKGKPRLSKTCVSFLESWVNEFVYNRKIEVTSKTMDKGNLVEDDAIIYASGHVKEMGLSSKNAQKFSNEWAQGEPDVISDEYVFDTKCSWSHDTFPLYSTELPEADYDWQVKGYMALTGKTKGRVVFVLMSMPEEMIEREARWKLGSDFTRTEYEAFAEQFRYDNLPAYLRIKEYEVEHDESAIEAIKKRVLECRAYIENTIIPALEINAKKYS